MFQSVLVSCDHALQGQPELLLFIQDFLLPLIDLGPETSLRIGGSRLISLWVEAAALEGASIDDYTGAALFTAIKQSRLAFLDRALQANVPDDVWTSVANYAVRNNQHELLEVLHEHLPTLYAPFALEIAADVGDMDLVRWIDACQFGGSSVTERTLSCAAARGNLEVVKWLFEHDKLSDRDTFVRRAMDHASMRGQLHVLQWLREHTDNWWSHHAIGAAVINGHLEIADWMFKLNQERLETYELKNFDLSSPYVDLTNVMIEGFQKGDLGILDWLREKGLLTQLSRKHFV